MPRYGAGPDTDLDTEEVVLPDGRRLTEELAGQIAAETANEARATAEGVTLSALTRDALRDALAAYLSSRSGPPQ